MLYSDEPDFQLADSLAVLRRDIPWDIYQVRAGRGWEGSRLLSVCGPVSATRVAAVAAFLLVNKQHPVAVEAGMRCHRALHPAGVTAS